MKSRTFWGLAALTLAASLFALAPSVLRASDHADPIRLQDPEANITDLFFYPKGDQMILIFNVRRSLTKPKPYNLAPYEYVVNMDLTTPVSFESAEDRARYGGTIITPEKIHADVSITVHLNDETTLKDISFRGLKDTDRIRTYTGVRDDPFTFPRFFKKNAITMVLSIPMTAFPAGQRDFLLWGTTWKDGTQIDHVGRSIRSQLPRFDALNTLAPKDHVEKLMELQKMWNNAFTFFNGFKEWWSKQIAALIQTNILIRKYDVVADVMVYTSRFPAGFPNGRLLLDDVSAQVCQTGDCILQELSFIEGGWPRATVNDKPFLDEWPYLAEPWPDSPEAPPSTKSLTPYIVGIVLVFAIVSWAVIAIILRLIAWLWHLWRRKAAVPA
jgi:hypothetical protein